MATADDILNIGGSNDLNSLAYRSIFSQAIASILSTAASTGNAQLQAQANQLNQLWQTYGSTFGSQAGLQGTLGSAQISGNTSLQTSQNQQLYNYAALQQGANQFAQQFGLTSQNTAFQQALSSAQYGLSSAEFQANQAQFGANFQEKQGEFNNTFGLQEDQFNFQKEQAALQLASNPFNSLNYMMYLGGMAASPIGTQPGYGGLNEQFNRYPLVDFPSPQQYQAPGAPSPTVGSYPGGVNAAALNASQNIALGGPMSSVAPPGLPGMIAAPTTTPGQVAAGAGTVTGPMGQPAQQLTPDQIAKAYASGWTPDQINNISGIIGSINSLLNPKPPTPAGGTPPAAGAPPTNAPYGGLNNLGDILAMGPPPSLLPTPGAGLGTGGAPAPTGQPTGNNGLLEWLQGIIGKLGGTGAAPAPTTTGQPPAAPMPTATPTAPPVTK